MKPALAGLKILLFLAAAWLTLLFIMFFIVAIALFLFGVI